MRRLILLLGIIVIEIITLGTWHPGIQEAVLIPTATSTPLPDSILPTFVPAYPCELQNAEARIEQEPVCRVESIKETILAQGDGVVFIQHEHDRGFGCMASSNQQITELHVCSKSSGVTQTLADHLTSNVIPSPDGKWFAFTTMGLANRIVAHIYRINSDGSDLQILDTHGLPEQIISLQKISWSADSQWINFVGWEGSFKAQYNGRIKAYGSGDYEIEVYVTLMPSPTFPTQPTYPSPTRGTPFIGTPPAPQPSATLPPSTAVPHG